MDRVDAQLAQGVAYYYQNKQDIDQTRPNIASTKAFDYENGYETGLVSITVPSGATVKVTDSVGVEIAPNSSGSYKVGSEDLTVTVSLDGCKDYVTTISSDTGSLNVEASDLRPIRRFTVSVPEGASYIVRDSSNNRVYSGTSTFVVGADEVATVIVTFDGYVTYTAYVPTDASEANIQLSDMQRLSYSAKITVPSGATLSVVDKDGNEVPSNADGTYSLVGDATYVLSVKLAGYKTYMREVSIASSSSVTVYRKDMIKLADIYDCSVAVEQATFAYTGFACEPTIIVKDGDAILVEGEDYTVSFADNTDVGVATATIEATEMSEKYTGSKQVTFNIVKGEQDSIVTVKAKAKTVKYKKLKKRAITVSGAVAVKNAVGAVKYKKVGVNKKANKFKVNAKTGKITLSKGLKRSTYRVRIKVTCAGDEHFEPYAKTVTVRIKVK